MNIHKTKGLSRVSINVSFVFDLNVSNLSKPKKNVMVLIFLSIFLFAIVELLNSNEFNRITMNSPSLKPVYEK